MSSSSTSAKYEASNYYQRCGCPILADKLRNCGKKTLVFFDKTDDTIHTIPARCNSQFCPECGKRKSNDIAKLLQSIILKYKNPNLRFLTLTQKSYPKEKLATAAYRFNKALNRIRARAYWKQRIKGYFLKLEITYNARRESWHFHSHLIVLSGHLDKTELKDEWIKASRGSYIIDIRATNPGTIAEFTKYVTKLNAVPDEKVSELVNYLATHRMYSFGSLFAKNRHEFLPEKFDSDWAFIGSIDRFIYTAEPIHASKMDFNISLHLYVHRREYPELTGILLDDLKFLLYTLIINSNNLYGITPLPVLDELHQTFG